MGGGGGEGRCSLKKRCFEVEGGAIKAKTRVKKRSWKVMKDGR